MLRRQQLRRFILENYLFTDEQCALGDDDSFLEREILDSTGIMELILFLEEQYGITVEEQEMTPDNLDSVSRLLDYLQRKQSAIAVGH
ncbi:acyl carrier protein [Alkalilimnicola sp. S0819]|uniref:acyl carrier protein n=1 Tax=Alkalilimnicola sp. S0819 TaxID=2613922 RepID=UPI001262829D|nr:acyl carrier protein [Alkalilimnicola sp. S0819]KAB7622849.1 acyl carrier protein [Alkalilimnicola sp. S0819]MPQ17171.1 acyl carrier protein [Alkalilimnicola sp. S0819]